MRKILVDKSTALGGNAPYNLVGVDDAFDWSSGSKGSRIGTHYTVLRIADMEKQRVFVPDSTPVVTSEAVLQGTSTMQFYKVDFEGFTASVSADKSGGLRIYAEATAIKFVKPETPPRKEA